MPSTSSLWDLMGPEGDGDWGLGAGGGEGGLQSWGSLASLFRPQTCSTLKIGEEKGNKKEGAGAAGGGAGGAGGGKFLQNLLNPTKKSVSFSLLICPKCSARHISLVMFLFIYQKSIKPFSNLGPKICSSSVFLYTKAFDHWCQLMVLWGVLKMLSLSLFPFYFLQQKVFCFCFCGLRVCFPHETN